MAVIRCPYCKAIIDENLEYCSNCGTQLLFPENENIEEEKPAELKEDEDESLKPPQPIEEEREEEREESELPPEQAEQIESVEEPLAEGEADEEEEKREEPLKEKSKTESEEEFSEKKERAQKEFTFKTEELEKIVDPAEKEKQEIDRFLASIKKERVEKADLEEEIPPDSSEIKEKIPETGDELPPWAEKIKESSSEEVPFLEEEEEREAPLDAEEHLPAEAEEPYEEKTPPIDSGIGIPEGVNQKSLPFDEKRREETGEIEVRPPSRFSIWLKSRVFDLIFIGALWLVTLWLASRVMEVPLFKLISASVLSVVIFYLVLLIFYFFLFLYFLGETLGAHLFSQKE